ncbi:MAG: GAF domain-containing protein [Syntrophotaleaceae bacterium]
MSCGLFFLLGLSLGFLVLGKPIFLFRSNAHSRPSEEVSTAGKLAKPMRMEGCHHLDEARLEALVALNHMASEPLENILHFIVASACTLSSSDKGYLALVDETDGTFTKFGWINRPFFQECALQGAASSHSVEAAGHWAQSARSGKPIIMNDYGSVQGRGERLPQGHVSITRFMSVPLLDQDKVFAVLGVCNKPGPYDQADIRQLTLLGQWLLRLLEGKRVVRELSESRQEYISLYQQFQILLDGIPDCLFLLESDMKIVWGNKAAASLMGLDGSELQGKTCFCLLAKRSDICSDCPVAQCFTSGRTEEGLFTAEQGRIFGIKAFPLKKPDGAVENVITLASDITEKMRFRREAEQAGRLASLGQLAAGVAHEINNPNGVLSLNTKILADFFPKFCPICPGASRSAVSRVWAVSMFRHWKWKFPRYWQTWGTAAGESAALSMI